MSGIKTPKSDREQFLTWFTDQKGGALVQIREDIQAACGWSNTQWYDRINYGRVKLTAAEKNLIEQVTGAEIFDKQIK